MNQCNPLSLCNVICMHMFSGLTITFAKTLAGVSRLCCNRETFSPLMLTTLCCAYAIWCGNVCAYISASHWILISLRTGQCLTLPSRCLALCLADTVVVNKHLLCDIFFSSEIDPLSFPFTHAFFTLSGSLHMSQGHESWHLCSSEPEGF